MKLLIILAILLLTSCAEFKENIERSGYTRTTESYRIYDEDGDFAGRIDGNYRVYDRNGNFIGRIKK